MDLKRFKKVLTNEDTRDNILKLIRNKRKFEKNHKKIKQKKFLTNRKQHDKNIRVASGEKKQQRTLIIKQ